MMYDLPETAILYADSARGIYIPQYFAETVNRYQILEWSKWMDDLYQLCKGPDSCEDYWEIWDDMTIRMELRDNQTGIQYRLYQDGDLWLVPCDWNPEES